MKQHTLDLLQYQKVCNLISHYCILDEGRLFCQNVKPSKDINKIERTKQCGFDTLSLLEKSYLPPLKYLPPIMPFLEELKSGNILEIEGIYSIFLLVILDRNIIQWCKEIKKEINQENNLLRIIDSLPILDGLYSSISMFMSEDGNIKEVEPLKAISKKIVEIEDEIKGSMQSFFSNPNFQDMLQSNLPTTKNNRQVIAVKANFKGKIKGIIHEYSHTAKTFYIEPEDVVIKNNRLQELKAEWEKEYFNILRRITNSIFENIAMLKTALSILIEIDFFLSLAKWANANNANFLMQRKDRLDLQNARHPLIKNCVPLNIKMEKGKLVLIITGANAGGKTVTLKTIALLALMNQTGMPCLADGSSYIPYFDFIGCDIGDEQSIENDVSTFQAQIKNISSIIEDATENSLILFDEMGSGTDIEEGGAIAMAILDEMIEKKTLTLVTTHHGILKKYAFSNPHCLNASVEFNSSTLKPTYKINIGLPGESHALDVASNNGLKENIVKKAQSYLDKNSSSVSHLINSLMEKQNEISTLEKKLLKDEIEISETKRHYDLKMLSLRQKELEIKKGAIKDATRLFDEKKKEIENLVRRVMEGEITKEDRQDLKRWIKDVGERLEEEKELLNIEEKKLNENENISVGSLKNLKVGDAVYSIKYKKEGIVLRLEKKDYALVSFENIKLTLHISDLKLINKRANNIENKASATYELVKDDKPLFELKILGLHMEEAREAILSHFDKLILNGVKEFSIVHGKGTGVLQQVVYDVLKSSSFVEEFSFARPEFGGTGKTIVKLK